MNIRMAAGHYQEVRNLTSISFLDGIDFPPETGCLLIVGRNDNPIRPSLLVAEVLIPQDEELVEQGVGGITFSSKFLRRGLFRVRERNLAGFLTVHTHPFADIHVDFSHYDNANDPLLMSNLQELQLGGVFGSIVLGKQSAKARLWKPGGGFSTVGDLVIVGDQLLYLSLDGMPQPPPAQAAEIFDRSLAITGQGALAQLSRMRIALVGGSGTGSIMAELLMRAGAGEIVLFEPDHMEEVNLNRVLHSRLQDAEARMGKAGRLAEAISEAGLPTQITVIPSGDIRKNDTALELRGCDLLIGCVDRDWPRLILCELAYQYLIPYIDIGTEIGVANNQIQSLDARVSYVAPGRPCLLCSGVISTERLRLEGMEETERNRVIGMGYSEDIRLSAPAVMDLNMRAASYAMLVVRHLLQPFLDTPLPTHIKEAITNYSVRRVSYPTKPECLICGSNDRFGVGGTHRLTTVS